MRNFGCMFIVIVLCLLHCIATNMYKQKEIESIIKLYPESQPFMHHIQHAPKEYLDFFNIVSKLNMWNPNFVTKMLKSA